MARTTVKADELCAHSGLSRELLPTLAAIKLLTPNRCGRYRSPLVAWASKLAYLLDTGWTIHEIKIWARARWTEPNLKEWPPARVSLPQESKSTP